MDRLIAIGLAAKLLGVSITTLRRWGREGKITPVHTKNGHRRYDPCELQPERFHATTDRRRTVAYARVSSHDQKSDLERQKQVLIQSLDVPQYLTNAYFLKMGEFILADEIDGSFRWSIIYLLDNISIPLVANIISSSAKLSGKRGVKPT